MKHLADSYEEFRLITGGRMKQTMAELEAATAVVSSRRPDVFLEVGSWCGGTLWCYARACAPGALVISVDIGRGAKPLGRTIGWLRELGYDAHWVRSSSHDDATLEAVRALLAGRSVDFLHVDGDHSRKGVLMDWKMYGPLLGPGGLAAFHDIKFRHGCRVWQAWPEIRASGDAWCELLGPDRKGSDCPLGIGLVWPPPKEGAP